MPRHVRITSACFPKPLPEFFLVTFVQRLRSDSCQCWYINYTYLLTYLLTYHRVAKISDYMTVSQTQSCRTLGRCDARIVSLLSILRCWKHIILLRDWGLSTGGLHHLSCRLCIIAGRNIVYIGSPTTTPVFLRLEVVVDDRSAVSIRHHSVTLLLFCQSNSQPNHTLYSSVALLYIYISK